jgi:curved DNA-binding protein CbpA
MRRGSFKDYYRTLGVHPTAGSKTIRAAYRRLSKIYHPDVCSEPHSTRHMQEINEAYTVLSSPLRRLHYDYARSGQLSQVASQAPPRPSSAPRQAHKTDPLAQTLQVLRPFLTFIISALSSRRTATVAVLVFLAVFLALPSSTREGIIIAIISLFSFGLGPH